LPRNDFVETVADLAKAAVLLELSAITSRKISAIAEIGAAPQCGHEGFQPSHPMPAAIGTSLRPCRHKASCSNVL
jgi:hypothetical protein